MPLITRTNHEQDPSHRKAQAQAKLEKVRKEAMEATEATAATEVEAMEVEAMEVMEEHMAMATAMVRGALAVIRHVATIALIHTVACLET